jgi:hypothetical protein
MVMIGAVVRGIEDERKEEVLILILRPSWSSGYYDAVYYCCDEKVKRM